MGQNSELEDMKKKLALANERYHISIKWVYVLNSGKALSDSLKSRNINQAVIYGATEFAVRLIECFNNENFTVNAITDKKIRHSGGDYDGIPLVTIDELEKMDMSRTCVIITAVGYKDEIKDELIRRNVVNVISLQDLIDDAL